MQNLIGDLLQQFEQGKLSRRQLVKNLVGAVTAASVLGATPAAASDGGLIRAVGINHISIQAPDYAAERDFMVGLLGVEVSKDDGHSCSFKVGETVILIRKPSVRRKAISGVKVNHGSETPGVDHISYTLANWETDPRVEQATRQELSRRGLPTGQDQIPGKSRTFHVDDPFGLGLQLGGKSQV
jgi:catechol 2,3-dioxygenase-like lactoylglutathione lyase family enzyme